MAKQKASESDFDGMGDFSLHILLWLFLPGMITGFLQKMYYNFRYKASSPYRPAAGSSRFKRDHDRCYVIVIGVYLFYCIFSSIYMMPPNYYHDFGVSTTTCDKSLKAQFRKYSLMYHPDRKPGPEAEGQFMRLRKIYESLTNPVLREAYNKFGSTMTCNGCILFKDFLWNGLMQFIGFYGGIAVVIIVLNIVGNGQFGTYWRFLAFFSMLCLEASMLILPYDPIPWFLPNSTVAEKISVIRQSITYVFMAITQFGPILFPKETAELRDSLRKVEKQALIHEAESIKYFENQLKPFIEDKENFDLLKGEIEKRTMHMRLFENDEDYRKIANLHITKRKNIK